MIASEYPDADLTPDLFVAMLPRLVIEAHLPSGTAAARSYVSAIAELVQASRRHLSPEGVERARHEVRSARERVKQRAANAPIDPHSQTIPRRLL